jgi:hypothetical protein
MDDVPAAIHSNVSHVACPRSATPGAGALGGSASSSMGAADRLTGILTSKTPQFIIGATVDADLAIRHCGTSCLQSCCLHGTAVKRGTTIDARRCSIGVPNADAFGRPVTTACIDGEHQTTQRPSSGVELRPRDAPDGLAAEPRRSELARICHWRAGLRWSRSRRVRGRDGSQRDCPSPSAREVAVRRRQTDFRSPLSGVRPDLPPAACHRERSERITTTETSW